MIKTYNDISADIKEICRYMRSTDDEQTVALVNSCMDECLNNMTFSVVYNKYDISIDGDEIDLTFAKIKSSSLSKFLEDKKEIVLFVATVGVGIDRLINKYSKVSPSKALAMQGIGIAYIEALCDRFNEEISQNHRRFSPGYGDLDLSLQTDIFRVLETNKIGVTLNDNLFMSPSKTVSAIIGV